MGAAWWPTARCAVTACAGSALPLDKKDQFARSDKSHIVRHKIGRWEKATGGPGTGDPARPRAGHFMIAQCVLILRAREHRPRRRAPVRPHSANWEKMGALKEVWPLRGRARRRRLSPPLEIAATVAGGLNVSCRVQRCGSFAEKDGFESGGFETSTLAVNLDALNAIARRWPAL